MDVLRAVCPRCGAIKAFYLQSPAAVKCDLCGLNIICGGRIRRGVKLYEANSGEIYMASTERAKQFFKRRQVVFRDMYGRKCRVTLFNGGGIFFAVSVDVGGEEIKMIYNFYNVPDAVRMLKNYGRAHVFPIAAVEYLGKLYPYGNRIFNILVRAIDENIKPEIAALLEGE